MTVLEHDEADPLERDVARDESASLEEREQMLAALRAMRSKYPRPGARRAGGDPRSSPS